VFYTDDLSWLMLVAAAAILIVLIVLNRSGVTALSPYLVLGAVLWFVVYRSGVHATLAGVALAMTVPVGGREGESPLERLENGLNRWVAFIVVPLFGFANAGVRLGGSGLSITDGVPLGVALGLFLGKQIGVFGTAVVAIKARLASFPERASWPQLYGVAVLCGIGFTMSLFIGLLAYQDRPVLIDGTKIGVLAGSVVSAVAGTLILFFARPRSATPMAGA
jgi:NhaA family Na+:H+ antiporter